MGYERNRVDIRGDGRVLLYQRPEIVDNPKWQCRISVEGTPGNKRFSTKTSDLKEAERIAIDKYFELKNKVDKGGSLKGKTIKQVFDEWSRDVLVGSGDRDRENVLKNTIGLVENTLVEFMGKKRVDEVTNSDLLDMRTWRFNDEKYRN